MNQILHLEGWTRPSGYANGVAARGRHVFIAGQIGWDAQNTLVGDDIVSQTRQALANIVAILAEAGGRPEHLVRLTWYVVDKHEYVGAAQAIGVVYRELIGRHYPAMTAVEVRALIEDRARIEIEATAVIPDQ